MPGEIELLNEALAESYRVSHEIGRGGMATVYQAHDRKHDRLVALKVLNPELAASLGSERFLREIAVTARLDHPHILPLLDSGAAGGRLYYVMPFVEGESLRTRLEREKQLSIDDAIQIARELADALGHAHGQGIIHRDVKPENILLSGGHARVADFGIARAVTAAGGESLTATGLTLGTPAYMSPEQASGERDVDARSDVYSLACVLYEMLAGEPPYTGATPEAVLSRKLVGIVPSLRVVRATVPAAVESAVSKALATAPADRFASARQFADALQRRAEPVAGAARSWRFTAPLLGAVAVVVALVIANVDRIRTRLTGASVAPKIESLAVLPLESLSADPEQEYFAAGMHEALIVNLGKLSGLRRVSARPSVLRYQKTDKTPRQIAQELGVGALISGTVLRSGNRVRITANLIDPASQRSVWSVIYEREVRDVLALQNEIVAAIAQQVRLQLSRGERAGLATARQVNPEAYQAYLKGKFQLNKFTPDGFEKGLTLLHQATVIDSTEPLAYAGLAQAYILLEIFNPASSPGALQRAKAAALKAVQLDETLAEAHTALGFVRGSKEWDYAAGIRSLRRAIELNPNLPEPHIYYSQGRAVVGAEVEAIAEMKRGIELDPLSPLYTAWLGGLYWEFGRFDEAIAEANKAMELQADFPIALFVLGLSYLDKGQHQEAIAAHEKALNKYPNQGFTWVLARTYALTGQPAKARKILARAKSATPGDAPHPWFIAAAYAALGENDEAMNWLEKAYDDRILFLPNLKRERAAGATFGALHTDPRFQALVRRLNLPE